MLRAELQALSHAPERAWSGARAAGNATKAAWSYEKTAKLNGTNSALAQQQKETVARAVFRVLAVPRDLGEFGMGRRRKRRGSVFFFRGFEFCVFFLLVRARRQPSIPEKARASNISVVFCRATRPFRTRVSRNSKQRRAIDCGLSEWRSRRRSRVNEIEIKTGRLGKKSNGGGGKGGGRGSIFLSLTLAKPDLCPQKNYLIIIKNRPPPPSRLPRRRDLQPQRSSRHEPGR